MTKLVTRAQMRKAEAAAVAAGTSERELMANAGLAAAQETWMSVGAAEGRPVLVLAGPGANGGDALVTAQHLAEWGAAVHVYLLRPRPDGDEEWKAVVEAEIPTTTVAEDPDHRGLESLLEQCSAVVDGLLGTGTSPRERPIEGDLAEIMRRLAAAREGSPRPQLIALDLPSGVDGDTGYADPLTVAADLTVTFGYAKAGLYQFPGHDLAGRIVPVEIGLPPAADLPYEDLQLRELQALMPPRPADAHKGTFGTVIVAAGSRRYPGAARLAAEAAARSGAGLVTLAAPAEIQALLVHGLPDVTHEPLPSDGGVMDGDAAARALLRALHDSRARALLVGPGLSLNDATESFVRSLLAGLDAIEGLEAAVFDADALNVLARHRGWHEQLSIARVLTPHPGEMARLTGGEPPADRLHAALDYAAETSSVVVLKGACTVIASPDGRARISGVANPALATAGTGDVLAGLIAGLLAQGMAPFDAASAAVYVHGESGRHAAEARGAAATLAQDVLATVGDARRLLDGDVGVQQSPSPGGWEP